MSNDKNNRKQQEPTVEYALAKDDVVVTSEETLPSSKDENQSSSCMEENFSPQNDSTDTIAVVIETPRTWVSRLGWTFGFALIIILLPLGAGGLCNLLSKTSLWNESGIGFCGTLVWYVFITTPLAILIVIAGVVYSVCVGRSGFRTQQGEKQERLVSKFDEESFKTQKDLE